MKKICRRRFPFLRPAVIAACAILLFISCRSSVPHYIWPKKDVQGQRVAGTGDSGKVLIAAQRSAYKQQVVKELTRRLSGSAAEIYITGLGRLDEEDGEEYAAIILINTCMAWKLDPRVARFLDDHPGLQERTVVFTTSGDGGWLPDLESRDWAVDALSGASAKGQEARERAAQKAEQIFRLAAVRLQ